MLWKRLVVEESHEQILSNRLNIPYIYLLSYCTIFYIIWVHIWPTHMCLFILFRYSWYMTSKTTKIYFKKWCYCMGYIWYFHCVDSLLLLSNQVKLKTKVLWRVNGTWNVTYSTQQSNYKDIIAPTINIRWIYDEHTMNIRFFQKIQLKTFSEIIIIFTMINHHLTPLKNASWHQN